MDGTKRATATIGALLALLVFPAVAQATENQRLVGDVTITGSEGRDDLAVSFDRSSDRILVVPAAILTDSAGTACVNDVDPGTNRPTRTTCRVGDPSFQNPTDLTLDLRGGNDAASVVVDPLSRASVSDVAVFGGAGNDSISIDHQLGRTLSGGDGDDTMAAPGLVGPNRRVSWIGGAGLDVANFAGEFTSFRDSAGEFRTVPVHVNASVPAKQVVHSRAGEAGSLVGVRTDALDSIESFVGGSEGDVLTGDGGPNSLIGGAGPDNISGGEGSDTLAGENGIDQLDGGTGADLLDGGISIDTFKSKATDGGDTYLVRDGFLEEIGCVKADIVVADLADKVGDLQSCSSVSVAQAKHRFDTAITGNDLRRADGAVKVRLACPPDKSEACQGKLRGSWSRGSLGSANYRIPLGGFRTVRIADVPPGAEVRLKLTETDADGLPREVVETRRVRRR